MVFLYIYKVKTVGSLSVVIITFNEEQKIEACISSVLGLADEVLVLDSFSTDQTPSICRSFPVVSFHQHTWQGYSAQKNLANSLAAHDWILSLDADEVLSEELRQSILAWKQAPVPAGFNRLTNYSGKWIRHAGWYPDFKFRLFDRRQTRWQGWIHEQLISTPALSEPVLPLSGDCLHYSFSTPEDHVTQTDNFSRMWAEQAFKKGKKFSFWKWKFGPWIRYFRDYVLLKGYKDGKEGKMICRVSARAIADRQLYLKALYEKQSAP